MAGLLDDEEDQRAAAERLRDLFAGTYTQGGGTQVGPVSAYFGEQRPRVPDSLGQDRTTSIGSASVGGDVGSFANLPVALRAYLLAQLQNAPQSGGDSFSAIGPGVSANLGPVGISAGMTRQQAGSAEPTWQPNFGANISTPLAGGHLSARAGFMPREDGTIDQNYGASFNRQIDHQSQIALMIDHLRRSGVAPETRAGVYFKKRF